LVVFSIFDVAAFQTYLDEDEYKGPDRWGAHRGALDDVTLYRGESMQGDMLNTPWLVVVRRAEEDPGQHARFSYTPHEQAVMIDAAREHLERLADDLYQRHF
jgi:hypothetical protein